jgi:hypothetical protein
MKVAWHEVPGTSAIMIPSRRVRYDQLVTPELMLGCEQTFCPVSHRPLRDGYYHTYPRHFCQATLIQSLRDIGCCVVASATRSQIPSYRIVSPISSTSILAVKPLARLW